MPIEVLDNYLEGEYFRSIADTMMSDQFPWFIASGVNHADDDQRQMIHIFYRANLANSGYFNLLQPMLDGLMASSLIRVKANLTPRSDKIVRHGLHRDQDFRCKIGILYINTNDGFTEFEDGTIVKSVANRMVIFDNDLLHGGTTCTDAHERIVININFAERIPV